MIHTVALPDGMVLPADLDAARNRFAIGFYEGCCSVNTTTLEAMHRTIAFDLGFKRGAEWGKAREIADTTTPTCHMRAIGHALGNDGLDLPGILEAINGLKLTIPQPIGALEMNRMLGLGDDAGHDRRMERLASTIESRAAAIRERDSAEEYARREEKKYQSLEIEASALRKALKEARESRTAVVLERDEAEEQLRLVCQSLALPNNASHDERTKAIRELIQTRDEARNQRATLTREKLWLEKEVDETKLRWELAYKDRNLLKSELENTHYDMMAEAARALGLEPGACGGWASCLDHISAMMNAVGIQGTFDVRHAVDKIKTLRACHEKFSQWSREVGEMLGTKDCTVGGLKDAVRRVIRLAWMTGNDCITDSTMDNSRIEEMIRDAMKTEHPSNG